MITMFHWKFLFLLGLAVAVYSACYDSRNDKVYSEGDIYSRTKKMGDSTLNGVYRCQCEEYGRIRCNATDIPCRDRETGLYVPKGELFTVLLKGLPYRCTCLGGRGRFQNCHLTGSTCTDYETSRSVLPGKWYTHFNFGQTLECKCGSFGEPVRHSCSSKSSSYLPTARQRSCVDVVTFRLVSSGSYYTTLKQGERVRCRCGYPESCDPPSTSVVRLPEPRRYPVLSPRLYPVPSPRLRPRPRPVPRPVPRPRPRPVPTDPEEGGQGVEITRRDPCIAGILNCDARARCVPEETSFSCICIDGFTGDGNTCADVDECTNQGACDENAECDNTVGSYQCRCNEGYRGDGLTCQKMCQDSVTGAYVPDGDTFVSITEGRRRFCTCRRGEVNEQSCIDDSIPEEETTVPSPPPTTTPKSRKKKACHIDHPGYYHAGESFSRLYRGARYRCTCVKRNSSLVSHCRPT